MHLFSIAATLAVLAVLAGVVYRLAGHVGAGRLPRAVLTGLAAAAALTAWAGTARHAALARAAAQPLHNGQHQSVTTILVAGFVFTFAVVTVTVLAIATAGARRDRRGANAPAGRRGRRAAARGW
jgi:integral membrane sensor domain MASE1